MKYFIEIQKSRDMENLIIFSSIFLEALKKQFGYTKDDNFMTSINEILEKLGFELVELFELLLLENKFDLEDIQEQLSNKYDDIKGNIPKMATKYKSDYFLNKIVSYRNNIIHTGNIGISKEKNIEIIKDIDKYLKKSYNGDLNNKILEELYENVENQLNNEKFKENDFLQRIILENLTLIILLELFNVDCSLNNLFGLPTLDNRSSKKFLKKFKS